MDKEQIQLELCECLKNFDNWQSVRHLMLKLKKENSEKVAESLLEIFTEDLQLPIKYQFSLQATAGGLLWKLKPKYNRNLKEDIKRSLSNWDVSIEELPWYFAEVKGIETVRNQVNELLTENLDKTSRTRAETYLYWLSVASEEEFKASLNRTWNGNLRG
jgi:hypothetical protein